MTKAVRKSVPYDLHPSVAHIQSILANLEVKTGRSLEAWVALVRKEAPGGTKARAAWVRA
jgi:hypothetical protein